MLERGNENHLEEQQAEPTSQSKPVRNRGTGHSEKTIKGELGEAQISVSRDRNSKFEPIIVKKGQTRFDGFDDKVLSLYPRGMSTRDIQAQL
ncbi:transposase [Cyanobacteria bacterium FACHB-502]|nr:transposase [Cyanobacteria bacterium FACHB-502]